MKNIHKLLLAGIVLCAQCSIPTDKLPIQTTPSNNPITVGVFDGYGGAQSCIWETVAAIRLDPEMVVRTITTSEIANNVLDSIDAIVIPGGSGSKQFLNLGVANQERIKDFIAGGKGAVGICAGAYLFSNTRDYNCMRINGEQAIDIEHDNRGHGLAKFTLNEEGEKIFPELARYDTCYVIYYEGPVFVKNPSDSMQNSVLATMESDVHEEGNAPENMTNGKPFFIGNNYGKGRVFSSIAHPEATPGMMWMIPRMIRWTLNKPIIAYKQTVVQPELFNRESLMSLTDLQQESVHYQTLLHGSSEQKIAALNWLEAHHSWEAKRWVQGLLYDVSPVVRTRAAEYIANTHYLPYLADLRSSYQSETDQAVKDQLKDQLDKLEALLP